MCLIKYSATFPLIRYQFSARDKQPLHRNHFIWNHIWIPQLSGKEAEIFKCPFFLRESSPGSEVSCAAGWYPFMLPLHDKYVCFKQYNHHNPHASTRPWSWQGCQAIQPLEGAPQSQICLTDRGTPTFSSFDSHPVSSQLFCSNSLSVCPGEVTSYRCLKLLTNSHNLASKSGHASLELLAILLHLHPHDHQRYWSMSVNLSKKVQRYERD